MYAKGMTTRDIDAHIREIYGLEVSDSTVSRITDKILPVVKEWQQRPLEEIYAVVFLDAIHYHVRSEGQIVKKAVYIAIGINMSGIKEVLGMWVGENESAKYWLSILNGLRNRGVEDILIACVDGLTGFDNAIEGFNRQLRKVTKSKSVFPTDDSLLKMLYLAMMDVTKKWTGKRRDWGIIHSQLEVFFADRLPD